MDIDFGFLKNPPCEFFNQMLNITGFNIIDFISILEAKNSLIGFILVFDTFDDILAYDTLI